MPIRPFEHIRGLKFICLIAWWYYPIFVLAKLIALIAKKIKEALAENRAAAEFIASVAATSAPPTVAESAIVVPAKPAKTFSSSIPLSLVPPSIDDKTQAYRYLHPLNVLDFDLLVTVFEEREYMLEIEQENGFTYAIIRGQRLGYISEHFDMIADFIQRGDPIKFFLKEYEEGKECIVKIVFYKDKAAPHKWREQTVVPLVSYKSSEFQDFACCAYSKEEVTFRKYYGRNNSLTFIVLNDGYEIGKVPKKIANRIESDGYSYAEIEEVIEEEDEDDYDGDSETIYHPVIRIYW